MTRDFHFWVNCSLKILSATSLDTAKLFKKYIYFTNCYLSIVYIGQRNTLRLQSRV